MLRFYISFFCICYILVIIRARISFFMFVDVQNMYVGHNLYFMIFMMIFSI
jgi:hypothetical protein